MSKNKVLSIVIAVLLVVGTLGLFIFYLSDVIVNNTPITKNLFRMLAAVCVCIGGLIRLFYSKGSGRRSNLSFYEKEYRKFIRDAFDYSPILKNKLLGAIRLYNEDKFNKALKYLGDLKLQCKTDDDIYAVNLFIALVLGDMGLKNEAIKVYNELVSMNLATTTIYGNLGSLHSGLGNYDDANRNLRLSIQHDENNPAPYQNLAKLYFDTRDFESSKRYALAALKINHKFRQSATLLVIVYSIEGDTENAEKYSHISIASGENPTDLKNSIEYFMSLASNKKDSSDANS